MRETSRKIAHIITGLDVGGAEVMLYKLLGNINQDKYKITVISLTDCGLIGDKIKELGIEVITLNMKSALPNPFLILKLTKILKNLNVELIQTWMYHADLIGFLAGKIAGIDNIVWGIHHSNLDPKTNKASTLKVVKACSKLSGRVTKIVCCSQTSEKVHRSIGYNDGKLVVIPNGFDTDLFRRTENEQDIKNSLNIPLGHSVIGHVARWDPLKDHHNFIKAMGIVIRDNPHITVLMCGLNIDSHNSKLVSWIKEEGIADHVKLLGKRDDVNYLMQSFDVFVSSSIGEAFPNVIGEAMASEVPCVVTNVGDCKFIVGDTGGVVEPNDSEQLAEGIKAVINLPIEKRKELGNRARDRIGEKFHIDVIVDEYLSLYNSLIQLKKGKQTI